MLPDGSVIIFVGTHNHGQGHETSLAQIAAHELGIDPERITLRYGDTAVGPFGFGTFASRSIVFAGGAVARASRGLADKIRRIGAHLLQADVAVTRLAAGAVHGPNASVELGEIAYAANVRQELLPSGMEPLLDVTATYEPTETGGVFSYGTHAAVVAVEPDTGHVEILDYVIAEDCGTMINPMIVDGQILGGVAQGIGTALYEEIPYDGSGQPLATSFADYLLPSAPEMPTIRIAHAVTPAPRHRTRGQGRRGGRRHRAARSHRQRRRRRVPRVGCKFQRNAADAASYRRCAGGGQAHATTGLIGDEFVSNPARSAQPDLKAATRSSHHACVVLDRFRPPHRLAGGHCVLRRRSCGCDSQAGARRCSRHSARPAAVRVRRRSPDERSDIRD